MNEINCKNFVGIDVSKDKLDVFLLPQNIYKQCSNTPKALKSTLKSLKCKSDETFVVLETTGGFEQKACKTLTEENFYLHRANTRHVKNFVRSLGQEAKTDRLDAKALAIYGTERHKKLAIYKPLKSKQKKLQDYAKRRLDLKQMLVKEKNRLKAPTYDGLQASVKTIIKAFEKEIMLLEEKLKQIISTDPDLTRKAELLQSFKGIGEATAYQLLADMPELGTLTRRQAGALAGSSFC